MVRPKAGFIESWGRGWQKICDGFTAAGLPKPTIESAQGGVLVTFRRNNVNLKTTDGTLIDSQNDSQTGGQTSGQTSGQTTEKVYELIKEDPYINRAKLSEILGISPSAIQKHIDKLKDVHIRRVGGDFGGHWEIIIYD